MSEGCVAKETRNLGEGRIRWKESVSALSERRETSAELFLSELRCIWYEGVLDYLASRTERRGLCEVSPAAVGLGGKGTGGRPTSSVDRGRTVPFLVQ